MTSFLVERCEPARGSTPLHGLDLGHLTLVTPGGTLTSKGRTPNQAMMLLPSLTELICGLARIAREPDGAVFDFHAIDSSLRITFEKKSNGLVWVDELGSVFAVELHQAATDAARAFLAAHEGDIDRSDASSEAAFADLEAALDF